MKRFGLIGKTLKHSFSQQYFTEKFEALGIDAVYENFELPNIDGFTNLIADNPDLSGLNVTIPYKTKIIPFLDGVAPLAREIGAINTVAFENGKTIGYNTDAIGFKKSIKPFLAHGMERALILGTGGASRAVHSVLSELGLDVLFVSRNPTGQQQIAYSDINENALKAFRLIVNTTPLGMYPNTESSPPIPYAYLSDQHLLYDLVYNPAETKFLKSGKKAGAETVNGLAMLHLQAEASWEIWTSQSE